MSTLLDSSNQDEIKAMYELKHQKADVAIVGITDCTTFTDVNNQQELQAIHSTKELELNSTKCGILLKGLNDGFEVTTTGQDELAALYGIAEQQRLAKSIKLTVPEVTDEADVVIIETLEKQVSQQIVIATPVEVATKEIIVTEEVVAITEPLNTTVTIRDIIKKVKDKNPKTKVKWSFKRK